MPFIYMSNEWPYSICVPRIRINAGKMEDRRFKIAGLFDGAGIHKDKLGKPHKIKGSGIWANGYDPTVCAKRTDKLEFMHRSVLNILLRSLTIMQKQSIRQVKNDLYGSV